MSEWIHLKAPNGDVIAMTLPLHPAIEQQWHNGDLQRVNEDGSPWAPEGDSVDQEQDDAPERPRESAQKREWVAYAVALGLCVQATVAHARAQLVADLSALAAAREVQRAAFGVPGAADPCTRAADVAAHDGGRLTTCDELTGGRARVTAVVETPLGAARATALAGVRPP